MAATTPDARLRCTASPSGGRSDLPVAEQRAALARLTPKQRRAAYERGELTYAQCYAWAARWPHEVPVLHGEFEFIALTMADLD